MNNTSKKKLSTATKSLQDLAMRVDKRFPIQVIAGHRGQVEQDLAFKNKVSKLKWPKSKHNIVPSQAIDVVPDTDRNPGTIDWKDIDAWEEMGKIFKEEAKKMGLKIRWGGDFKTFKDYPHVELI